MTHMTELANILKSHKSEIDHSDPWVREGVSSVLISE